MAINSPDAYPKGAHDVCSLFKGMTEKEIVFLLAPPLLLVGFGFILFAGGWMGHAISHVSIKVVLSTCGLMSAVVGLAVGILSIRELTTTKPFSPY